MGGHHRADETGDEGMTDADLVDRVRRVVEDNRYLVLGTADEAGRPWAAPVFYAADACRAFHWISSPDVRHSRNLAARPEVGIVIFDSTAPVGTGDQGAVYMEAVAAEVAADDLDDAVARSAGFAARFADLTAADLRSPAPYRLYTAVVTSHSTICPRDAGVPCSAHGLSHDHRTEVVLPR